MKAQYKQLFFEILNIPDDISRMYNICWLAICVKKGELKNPPPTEYFRLVRNMFALQDMASFSLEYLKTELEIVTLTDKKGNVLKMY